LIRPPGAPLRPVPQTSQKVNTRCRPNSPARFRPEKDGSEEPPNRPNSPTRVQRGKVGSGKPPDRLDSPTGFRPREVGSEIPLLKISEVEPQPAPPEMTPKEDVPPAKVEAAIPFGGKTDQTAVGEKEPAPATPEQPLHQRPGVREPKHGGNRQEADTAHQEGKPGEKVVRGSPAQDPTAVGIASNRRRRRDSPTRLLGTRNNSSQKTQLARREHRPARSITWDTEIVPANSLGRPPENTSPGGTGCPS